MSIFSDMDKVIVSDYSYKFYLLKVGKYFLEECINIVTEKSDKFHVSSMRI